MNKSEPMEFLKALVPTLPEDQRIILCGFPGDPGKAEPNAWQPRPWRPGQKLGLNAGWNAYSTVASFHIAPDKTWRRKKGHYAAAHALMVDDVGTGKGAKVAPDRINVPPSAIIETSPDNFQYWYFFDKPEPDAATFDALIRAFIDGRLLGSDPGMSGVTRVGRLPGFPNLKPKYKGFITRLTLLEDLRYSISDLVSGFDLTLQGRQTPRPTVVTEESIRRNRAFVDVYNFLHERKMLKRAQPDAGGWTEMSCPWVHEHTGSIDNGAAIREPDAENGWHGAFRCHHGSHMEKRWRDLCEWINDIVVDELDAINKSAE